MCQHYTVNCFWDKEHTFTYVTLKKKQRAVLIHFLLQSTELIGKQILREVVVPHHLKNELHPCLSTKWTTALISSPASQ